VKNGSKVTAAGHRRGSTWHGRAASGRENTIVPPWTDAAMSAPEPRAPRGP